MTETEAVALMAAGAAALEEARATIKRLNRRCQAYESGLAEKIEKAHQKHRTLGRLLANAAATMYQRKYEEAAQLLRQVQDERKECALCSGCGALVEMRGVPCMVGVCECGKAVLESDAEFVDPVKLFAERSKRWATR